MTTISLTAFFIIDQLIAYADALGHLDVSRLFVPFQMNLYCNAQMSAIHTYIHIHTHMLTYEY